MTAFRAVAASTRVDLSSYPTENASEGYINTILKQIANCKVAHRPGRIEPRVLKRRRHGYTVMTKPREELRDELRKPWR